MPKSTFIMLLRAINVAGNNLISMANLRELLVEIGFADARTLLQSGNVVLTSTGTAAAIERRVAAAVADRFHATPDILVRSAADWQAMVSANPFARETARDPAHTLAMVLRSAPATTAVDALVAAIAGPERVHVCERTAYLLYPVDIGHSKLTAAVIERHLGTRGTARNWNTVLKLNDVANP